MIHISLPLGPLQCNCSVFGDEQSRDAIVIDPGDEIEKITDILDQHRLKAKAIIITHAHLDHVAAAQLLKELTGAPIYMNESDRELLNALALQARWLGMKPPRRPEVDSAANDGTVLHLGKADFHIILTPGHTQGSLSVWIPSEEKLIAGDTLFRESIGRTDLPGGNPRQLLASIKTRLLELPQQTIVFPGHGPTTTLGWEKEHNPFLQGI